jgi:hypothetical protein
MSQDAGGEAKTIACPKCGEKNMAVDVRCWACDAELHPAPAPHEPAPAEAPLAPAEPVPQDADRAAQSFILIAGTIGLGLFFGAIGAAFAYESCTFFLQAAHALHTGHAVMCHRLAPTESYWRAVNPGGFWNLVAQYLGMGVLVAGVGGFVAGYGGYRYINQFRQTGGGWDLRD